MHPKNMSGLFLACQFTLAIYSRVLQVVPRSSSLYKMHVVICHDYFSDAFMISFSLFFIFTAKMHCEKNAVISHL